MFWKLPYLRDEKNASDTNIIFAIMKHISRENLMESMTSEGMFAVTVKKTILLLMATVRTQTLYTLNQGLMGKLYSIQGNYCVGINYGKVLMQYDDEKL